MSFESDCPLQILGNKSLKIKYLNPSTVFVASGPPEGLLTEDLDPNSLALTVHLVDTVTGAPIYSQTHKVGLLGTVDHRSGGLLQDNMMSVLLHVTTN